jgi:hypothetical protein
MGPAIVAPGHWIAATPPAELLDREVSYEGAPSTATGRTSFFVLAFGFDDAKT